MILFLFVVHYIIFTFVNPFPQVDIPKVTAPLLSNLQQRFLETNHMNFMSPAVWHVAVPADLALLATKTHSPATVGSGWRATGIDRPMFLEYHLFSPHQTPAIP